jgi:hypothetical protein
MFFPLNSIILNAKMALKDIAIFYIFTDCYKKLKDDNKNG